MIKKYDPNSDQTLRSQFRWAYRRPPTQDPIWTSMPQPANPTPWGRIAAFGGVVGGIFGAGVLPTSGGKRVFDFYHKGLRTFEELSPGKILRTFQFSDLISPLTSSNLTTGLTPKDLTHKRTREFIANMLGKPMYEVEQMGVFNKGLEFQRTVGPFGTLKVAGKGGAILSHAAIPMDTLRHSGGTFSDWYARVSGVNLGINETLLAGEEAGKAFLFAPRVKLDKVLGIPISETARVFLDRSRTSIQVGRAYAAAQMGRLNRLLQTPAELFPQLGNLLSKAGLPSLTVKPGPALSMLGRYAGLGLAIGGGIRGAQYLSYLRSQSDNRFLSGVGFAALGGLGGGLLRRTKFGALAGAAIGLGFGTLPVFDKGIIPGFGTMATRVSLAGAHLSQATGMTQSAKEQEALMPGITKWQTVAGFAGIGSLIGGMGGYAQRLRRIKSSGVEATTTWMQTQEKAIQALTASRTATSTSIFGKVAARFGGTVGAGVEGGLSNRILMRGGRIGGVVGAAAFGAWALTGALATGHLIPGIFSAKYTPEELKQFYSGEKEVAVRAGRGWEAGRSRFEGGRAYYRPHWYRLMQTRARDIGMYDTEEEKFASSPLLHPIKALTDEEFKYRWEKKHYYSRPYGMTGTYGSSVPFIAPLTEAVGSLIKPPKTMHLQEWTRNNQYGELEAVHIPTAGEDVPAYDLGNVFTGWPQSRFSPDQQAGELAYRLQELRGLPGFIHGAVKEKLTGSADYFDQYEQIETATRATGFKRGFWNLQLGGGALTTESIRRFIPHERNQIEQYNPIGNTQPSWMPSEDYFTDFRRGDPHTKVVEGEIRLPGPGYTALNPELAGVSLEDYPTFHKFKILADVALWSDQFKASQHQVQAAIKRGELSPSQIAQVETINQQAKERKQRKRLQEYQFSQNLLEKQRITVKEHLPGGLIQATSGEVFGMGGIDTKGYRRQQARVSDFLREHVAPGAEMDVFVHRDPLHQYKKLQGSKQYYMPALLGDLNKQAVESGVASLTSEKTDPFSTQIRYNTLQRRLGSLWETTAHYESPLEYLTPFSPKAKFIHQRSAIEEYERSRGWGTEAAFWQHPISQFAQPAKQMAAREWLGSQTIPENVQKRWAVEEYFDKLKYMKYRALEEAAKQVGDTGSAQEFQQQQRRTVIGTNLYGNPANVFASLPSLERDYFHAFADAKTEEDRRRITGMIAPNQRALYAAQWERQLENTIRAKQSMGTSTQEADVHLKRIEASRAVEGRPINEELLAQYAENREEGERYADWSRRQELQQYFQKAPLPKADFVGWHPTVDLEDVKLQVVQNLGMDMHEFNLWEGRKRDLVHKPYLDQEAPLGASGPSHPALQASISKVLRETLRLNNVQVSVLPAPSGTESVDLEIEDDRTEIFQHYKRDNRFMNME